MKAAVIAAPRRLALIGAASFLVPPSLVVLAYGAIERRVSLQEQAKEMTPERSAQRIFAAADRILKAGIERQSQGGAE